MTLRHKLGALLGAGLLTFAVAGVALASTSDTNQNLPQALSTFDTGSTADCAAQFPDLGAGEVGLHFVLTSTNDSSGNLSGVVSGTAFGPVASGANNGTTLSWEVTVTGDGTSTLDSATTDADGNNLVLSHVCYGAPAATGTPAPTPSPTGTGGGGGGGGGGGPTQPPTDTLGSTNSSGPSDGAWLLVVALGVLLASIVVLTPARAKNRR